MESATTISKDLLDIEMKNNTSSSLESTLLVCQKDSLPQNPKPQTCSGKLVTSSVAKSQEVMEMGFGFLRCGGLWIVEGSAFEEINRDFVVGVLCLPLERRRVLGKVKDFLGVMAEANARLQCDAKEKSFMEYDIEALTGNETEYVEMLVKLNLQALGVADLHSPEAVAAAEFAMAGSHSVIPLPATCCSGSDNDTRDDDINNNNDGEANSTSCSSNKPKKSMSEKDVAESNERVPHQVLDLGIGTLMGRVLHIMLCIQGLGRYMMVVLGACSFLIEPMCQRMGARLVWALSNFTVFACMAAIAVICLCSIREYSEGIQHAISGYKAVKIASLVVFALLGFPLSITYSVPFSVTAEFTADSGGGQGLATGVLNLAIVIPQ
ncbi:hypothetical protein IFM89_019782, partial [Coptis chinensis]